MNNVVYRQELIAGGVASRTIKQARSCCLLRIGSGVYSITRDCQISAHRRIAHFIDDVEWINFHTGKTRSELTRDFDYQTRLRRLQISSYRWYRADDTISGTSAAVLHGIPLYKGALGPITVLHPSSNSTSNQIKRTRCALVEDDKVMIGHLRATSAVRTSLDLAHVQSQQSAFAGMEWVLRQSVIRALPGFDPRFGYTQDFRDLGPKHIAALFRPAIARMRTGQAVLQSMAEVLNPASESIAESFCSFNLKSLKISGFEQQVEISDAQGFITRADFLHPGAGTIVAVDGSEKYALVGPSLLRREGEQHNRLLSLGCRVVHFTFQDLLSLAAFSAKLFEQSPDLRRYVGDRG